MSIINHNWADHELETSEETTAERIHLDGFDRDYFLEKSDIIAAAKHFGLVLIRNEKIKPEEMPIFKGTREALNNLTVKGESNE